MGNCFVSKSPKPPSNSQENSPKKKSIHQEDINLKVDDLAKNHEKNQLVY